MLTAILYFISFFLLIYNIFFKDENNTNLYPPQITTTIIPLPTTPVPTTPVTTTPVTTTHL